MYKRDWSISKSHSTALALPLRHTNLVTCHGFRLPHKTRTEEGEAALYSVITLCVAKFVMSQTGFCSLFYIHGKLCSYHPVEVLLVCITGTVCLLTLNIYDATHHFASQQSESYQQKVSLKKLEATFKNRCIFILSKALLMTSAEAFLSAIHLNCLQSQGLGIYETNVRLTSAHWRILIFLLVSGWR